MSVDVAQQVRRVLVKNWLDMGKVRLQTAGGTVIVRGRLVKSRGEDKVNALFIEQLEQQLRGTKGLKQLRFALEDWIHERGKWIPRKD